MVLYIVKREGCGAEGGNGKGLPKPSSGFDGDGAWGPTEPNDGVGDVHSAVVAKFLLVFQLRAAIGYHDRSFSPTVFGDNGVECPGHSGGCIRYSGGTRWTQHLKGLKQH